MSAKFYQNQAIPSQDITCWKFPRWSYKNMSTEFDQGLLIPTWDTTCQE